MSSNLHSCLGPGRINITELQFLSTENARGINRRQIGNLQPLYFRSVGDLLGDLLLPRTRLSLSIPSTRPSLSHWFNLFFFSWICIRCSLCPKHCSVLRTPFRRCFPSRNTVKRLLLLLTGEEKMDITPLLPCVLAAGCPYCLHQSRLGIELVFD